MIRGTMDVFLKLDSFGADLLTRTIGPFVGRTADHNFVETSTFISQINDICEKSPGSAYGLAMSLDKVDSNVRREFAVLATGIARKHHPDFSPLLQPNLPRSSTSRSPDKLTATPKPIASHYTSKVRPVARTGDAIQPEPGLKISRLDTVTRITDSADSGDDVAREPEAEFGESNLVTPKKSSLIMRR